MFQPSAAASSSSGSDAQSSDVYNGFIGLNTHDPEFPNHVMSPKDVMNFFGANNKFEVKFIYPKNAADSFQSPSMFSGENIVEERTFTLKEEVISNHSPHSFSGFIAKKFILPATLKIENDIEFSENAAEGFGQGSFLVRSMRCTGPDGKEACLAQAVIATTDRRGLFLKVTNEDEFYDNVAIYFPDKAKGLTHKGVYFGEAFVLVREDLEMNPELAGNINTTFNKLVKKSYGQEGLYHIGTGALQSIEEYTENTLPVNNPGRFKLCNIL